MNAIRPQLQYSSLAEEIRCLLLEIEASLQAAERSLARTRHLIARRVARLTPSYARGVATDIERRAMVCVLCDHEAPELNRLKFKASNQTGDYPGVSVPLMLKLEQFGVCDPCIRRYEGHPHVMLAELNSRIAEARRE